MLVNDILAVSPTATPEGRALLHAEVVLADLMVVVTSFLGMADAYVIGKHNAQRASWHGLLNTSIFKFEMGLLG